MSLVEFFNSDVSHLKRLSRPLHTPLRCTIATVPVDRLTLDEATAQIIDVLRQRTAPGPFLIMGPNAQLVTLAQSNPRFAEALRASALNIADGISVVLASMLLGRPISERTTGGDLMERLCSESARHGLRVFFLGGLPGAAHQSAIRLQRRYPALSIAGTYCPPLGFEHDSMEGAHVRQLIVEAEPDLLFVAFGAPKQEIWMRENCPTLPIGAALSVGAAFDTQAGLRRRAPRWTHRLGMEWLYRLIREPRRLWRRYLIGNTYFLCLVMKQLYVYGRFAPDKEDPSFLHIEETSPSFSVSQPHQAPLGPIEAESQA
jgi:N-acetylglucosaminyldiphosphoundecaprenol N-acetyl-beta-D-mannosaminyltransferase